MRGPSSWRGNDRETALTRARRKGHAPEATAKANIRFIFQAMVTSLHSPRTLSSPRNRNCRKPITDLMMPNTGSGVCLRNA